MIGIAESIIAAILYGTGGKLWAWFNDPLANAIDNTIKHFSQKKNGFEIKRERFAALLEGSIGEDEINCFKDGEKFIEGDKLALQFAIFGGLYFDDESKTLKIATEVFSYFKKALIDEFLKDPNTSIQTLWSLQSITLNISQQEHKKMMDELRGIIEILKRNVNIKPDKELTAPWPEVSLPFGGAKVSEPFAGRVEELGELMEAMGGDKTIVAVVGMAGQGKSCLAGEWYKRGARSPEGVGLFWRKVYEPGFTFDKFLDELHLYLTGEHIDRHAIATVEARAVAVESLLKDNPCWIVLDGVERWLKLWAAEPDAGVENPSADDKAGQDPVFDKFLTGASFWDNGSRLLLTTRAVPGALDENPPVRIGRKRKADAKLAGLKPADAVKLLRELSVKGNKEVLREAVDAYGCHPYAVHVLGVLIRDLYGGDGSQWQQVNPLGDTKLDGLFERIIEHRGEDLELLEHIACSVGPAPVAMLAERLGLDEPEIRRKLAELARWQMVEFDGGEAGQHTVVRKFLTERMGRERVRELQKQIAGWWAGREVPDRPEKIEDIRPLLKAIEHLLTAREPLAAMHIFFTKTSAESYYTVNDWLLSFGYLDEDIRICSDAIRVYEELIEKESRLELRNKLAMCYLNRGAAFFRQGKLDEAIADSGRAIEIYELLVEKESRRELRNDLAGCYNNRGLALAVQGKPGEAIADYGRAIKITEQLVVKESRREVRNDLASCYNNRGLALADQGKLDEAIDDYGRAIEIREQLVEKESRRELRSGLASCYNNRGLALADQDKLDEAIDDYGRAIEITEQLVVKESRRELRNDLAMSYNNRGLALADQGKLDEAIDDYGRAIEIRERLVVKESRRELRSNLESNLFNRALAFSERKEWKQAAADVDKGGGLLRELIEEGRRHVIGSFLKTAGFRCRYAKELGDDRQAAQWANDGMRWFIEEAQAGRMNELLIRDAALFAGGLKANIEVLVAGGLVQELSERFLKLLNDLASD